MKAAIAAIVLMCCLGCETRSGIGLEITLEAFEAYGQQQKRPTRPKDKNAPAEEESVTDACKNSESAQ